MVLAVRVRTVQVATLVALAVGAALLLAQVSVPGQDMDDRSQNVIRQSHTDEHKFKADGALPLLQHQQLVSQDGINEPHSTYANAIAERDVSDTNSGLEAPRVQVATFVEALCPDSARFIVDYMTAPVFPKSIWDIADVKYLFWGNVKISLDGTPSCQHGIQECDLNILMDCALAHVDSNNSHSTPGEAPSSFNIVHCLFQAFKQFHGRADSMKQAAQKCIVAEGVNYGTVEKCLSRGFTDTAVVAARDETDSLNPPHTWVPWVTVNGKPINQNRLDDASKLAEAVCQAFSGHPRPVGCAGFHYPEEKDESAVGVA